MRLKENWQHWSLNDARNFLRVGPEGKAHPSRAKAIALLENMSSVLDVGCGTGVMFELIQKFRPDLDYFGVDTTEIFLNWAQRIFPNNAHRFRLMSLYELDKLRRKFDAVLCRHVLEHLPDYVPAVQSMYACAAKKLILIFYLPPAPLRSGRKRDEGFERGFYTHTYDLGKFLHHLTSELSPPPTEIRIHPRQGRSDPKTRWGDRENIIYEVIRPTKKNSRL